MKRRRIERRYAKHAFPQLLFHSQPTVQAAASSGNSGASSGNSAGAGRRKKKPALPGMFEVNVVGGKQGWCM